MKNRVPKQHESGSSLIEVLIAVLIMSFGLLSLGSLTAASVQYGKFAQFQTIGLQLATDLSDRMRANTKAFQSNEYDLTNTYSSSSAVIATPTPSCSGASVCTKSQIAALDLVEWRNDLRRRLPGGDAYVLRDTTNPLAVDVWIMWSEGTVATGLETAGGNDCPAAAISGVSPVPRCAYFRFSI